jgi:asparagine synthase (glutamine-hydrolysing)
MSGFAAILNLDGAPVDRVLLKRLSASLAFRGPDAQRVHVAANAGLAHTLLKISGESEREEQPFTLDGQQWIVGDVRLDARDALIAELTARDRDGCAPDVSDTELLFRAYDAWGEDCVAHLLGDFSFAIWDAPRRRLFSARDHLGVKPCFYAQVGQTVVVSNTLDCVRLHPAVSDDLHEPAIADFLMFGVNHESDTTVFSDVKRLPPAHCITWSADAARCRRYWTLPIDEPVYFKRADDYSDRFAELLRTAMRDRLRTRRVGVLMSGGLDSTTLAATALSVFREQPAEFVLHAITSVYDRLIPHSDRHYAGLAAAHLDIPLRFDVRDDEISIADWNRASVHTPEPVANPMAFVAGVEFARKMAPETPVLLYGEGPDDALRYEWRAYVSHLVGGRRVAALARAIVDDVSMHPRVPFWSSIRQIAGAPANRKRWAPSFPDWLNEDFAARCECKDRWDERLRTRAPRHPVRPRAYEDFHSVLWQALFEDCDIVGALGGAEFRHPFVDVRLLRYLLAVPAIPWCRNKLIIRRAMRTALPRDVVWRKKAPLAASPDFERIRVSGLPRIAPSFKLLRYVNPEKVPHAPRSEMELRAALRPLGLSYWLQQLSNTHIREIDYGTESAVSPG